jgi:hypothetical protein
VHELGQRNAGVELLAGRMARGGQPAVGRDVAVHAHRRDRIRFLEEVAQAQRDCFLVGAFHLVRLVVAAPRPVAALARNAGVRVAAENRGVALHAGSLEVVGVGQSDRLRVDRRLGCVELLARVVVRLAPELGRLFLLPLRGRAGVLVAGHALAGADVLILGGRGRSEGGQEHGAGNQRDAEGLHKTPGEGDVTARMDFPR